MDGEERAGAILDVDDDAVVTNAIPPEVAEGSPGKGATKTPRIVAAVNALRQLVEDSLRYWPIRPREIPSEAVRVDDAVASVAHSAYSAIRSDSGCVSSRPARIASRRDSAR